MGSPAAAWCESPDYSGRHFAAVNSVTVRSFQEGRAPRFLSIVMPAKAGIQ
jgi:hypothetical protein